MGPDTNYENVDQEMTSRAPHEQYVYGAEKQESLAHFTLCTKRTPIINLN